MERDTAIEDPLHNSVEQAMGTLVDSQTWVENLPWWTIAPILKATAH
jgi:hypothetical protein